jgi:hypothetical protein
MTNESKEGAISRKPDFEKEALNSFRIYYRRRFLILIGVLAAALLSIFLALVLPKAYLSEGFYQLSDPVTERTLPVFSVASEFLDSSKLLVFSQLKEAGLLEMFKELEFDKEPPNLFLVTVQDFKKYSSRFENYQEFLRFAGMSGKLDEGELSRLKKEITSFRKLSKKFKEVYALSKDDLKDVGKSLEDEKNFISGVKLEMEGRSPSTALKYVQIFGEYIGFSSFHEKLFDYVTSHLNKFQSLRGRYDNYILRNRSLLARLNQQSARLKALEKKYPRSRNVQSQMVVDTEANSQRYISPLAQIVGAESRIVDVENLLEIFASEKRKAELFTQYFDGLRSVMEESAEGGERLLEKISSYKASFFQARDMDDLEIKEVFNSITTDIGRFHVLFSKTLRFISGPTYPDRHLRPRMSVVVSFGVFLGILFFVSLAFFLEFWQRNKRLMGE